jgi:hypothetical protein
VATLAVVGENLVVKMSWFERLEACHSDVSVRRSGVREVRVVDTAWPELRGVRAPGTGIPGVVAVGTRRGGFGKDFAVVHGKGPAVVVELEGEKYARLVVTTEDAGALARTVTGTPGN